MKLDRNDELEADRLGLMMMAQAGIHPDYALTLMDRLKHVTGDRSKFAAFLTSDHPRWETREKKTKQVYQEALLTFQTRWKDSSQSPGGTPPKQ
jgi:predicted Zn-dependent protease